MVVDHPDCLHKSVTNSGTETEPMEILPGSSLPNPRIRYHEQGPPEKRLHVCRFHYLLRFYAGSRDGQRPSARLLSLFRGRMLKTLCHLLVLSSGFCLSLPVSAAPANAFEISEDDNRIKISTPLLEAVVQKKNYVTGVYGGTFLDKTTGFRDAGYGFELGFWRKEENPTR